MLYNDPHDPGFPTEQEFLAWWEGQIDIRIENINAFCPIARCLLARGFHDVVVGCFDWETLEEEVHPLPSWAKALIFKFDSELDSALARKKPKSI